MAYTRYALRVCRVGEIYSNECGFCNPQGNSSGSKSAGTAVLSGDTEEVVQAG